MASRTAAAFLLVLSLAVSGVLSKCGDPNWACCGPLHEKGTCNGKLTCVGRTSSQPGGCFRPGCGSSGEPCCTNRAVKNRCTRGLSCDGQFCVPPPGVPSGIISTAITAGQGGSQIGAGVTTTTGNTNTFTSKLPAVAIGSVTSETGAAGFGPAVGSVGSATFADVRAPGTLNQAIGSSSAQFGAQGPGPVVGTAKTIDASIATNGVASNRIESTAAVAGTGPVASQIGFSSFTLDP